jgi:galactonate dehydratase
MTTDRGVVRAITVHAVPPRWLLVRVETDDGRYGWGEAIVAKRKDAVVGAIRDFERNLIGSEVRRVEEATQAMRIDGFFRGGPILATAAAAIEHALWDLKGRWYDAPVYELLGGPVREEINTYSWIGGDNPSDVVSGARARIEQGFRLVKMNATPAVDWIKSADMIDGVLGRLQALRDEFGDDLDIAVDFHGRVHLPLARVLIPELAPFRLLWVEEPLPPGHEALLPELSRHAKGVPLATGERSCSRWEFRELLTGGGVSILQPDVSLTGLAELAKIARMAEAYDVAVIPHCPNGPVSLAASLQVAWTTLNTPWLEQSVGMHYNLGYDGLEPAEMSDYLLDKSVLMTVEGRLRRTDTPGLGIELDLDAIASSDATWQLRDPRWRLADGRLAEW